jgi:hypothetical protein
MKTTAAPLRIGSLAAAFARTVLDPHPGAGAPRPAPAG